MAPRLPVQSGKARAKAAEVIDASHDLINDALPELTQTLIDMALGLRFQDEKGNVYTKEPNIEALKRCHEIVMGKPVAKVETGAIGDVSEYEEWIKGMQGASNEASTPHLTQPILPRALLEARQGGLEAAKDRMEDVLKDLGGGD